MLSLIIYAFWILIDPSQCELSIKYRGEKHTSDVLDSEDCLKYIKMSGPALRSLCQMLDTNQLIDKTWNISTEQKLMLFFCVFAQNMTYDTIRVQFHRSVNTTHRAVNEVRDSVIACLFWLTTNFVPGHGCTCTSWAEVRRYATSLV